MSAITEAALLSALQTVVDPNTAQDFGTGRQLKNLRIDDTDVSFEVELGYPGASQFAELRRQRVAAARTVPGVANVSVHIASRITAPASVIIASATGVRKPASCQPNSPWP